MFRFRTIRGLAPLVLLLSLVFAFARTADATLVFSNRYRSPRNPERKIRRSTSMIVLHTTEGGARGSLNKVCERGECHFCVVEDGTVYRIVDREREAFHAGRSMWCGREDCDEYSIGIEVVGYHDKPVTKAQIDALRELIAYLKVLYRLTDTQVVCHSHVAYGAPNRWQRRRHRGRKRCGMLFAMPSVRRQLGLRYKPGDDPDVRAGRLVQADPYLAQVLYGTKDTMVGRIGRPGDGGAFSGIARFLGFGSSQSPARRSDATSPAAVLRTTKVTTTKVVASAKGGSPKAGTSSAGQKSRAAPRKSVGGKKGTAHGKKGTVPRTLAELKMLKGYRQRKITPGVTAKQIAGRRWNGTTTFYWTRGKVVPGNRVDAKSLEKGALVFYPEG